MMTLRKNDAVVCVNRAMRERIWNYAVSMGLPVFDTPKRLDMDMDQHTEGFPNLVYQVTLQGLVDLSHIRAPEKNYRFCSEQEFCKRIRGTVTEQMGVLN